MKFVSIYVIIFYEVGLVLLKFSTKNLQYSTTDLPNKNQRRVI